LVVLRRRFQRDPTEEAPATAHLALPAAAAAILVRNAAGHTDAPNLKITKHLVVHLGAVDAANMLSHVHLGVAILLAAVCGGLITVLVGPPVCSGYAARQKISRR